MSDEDVEQVSSVRFEGFLTSLVSCGLDLDLDLDLREMVGVKYAERLSFSGLGTVDRGLATPVDGGLRSLGGAWGCERCSRGEDTRLNGGRCDAEMTGDSGTV